MHEAPPIESAARDATATPYIGRHRAATGQHAVCLICHRERPADDMRQLGWGTSMICATEVFTCHQILYDEHTAWEDEPDYQHPDGDDDRT